MILANSPAGAEGPIAADARGNRHSGIALSLLLHLCALLVVFGFFQKPVPPERTVPPVVAIDIVKLGDETTSPPAARKSPMPLQSAAPTVKQQAANPRKVEGIGKGAKPVPLDNIDAKLRALAKLRQPQTDPRLLAHNGLSNIDAGNAANGADATYSVRDYVRAEIERHWNLDLAQLGGRDFSIPLHVILKRNGTIVKAEIVESPRFRDDKVYRFVAISARNAALLSSPLKLPPGNYAPVMDMVLNLRPREALR